MKFTDPGESLRGALRSLPWLYEGHPGSSEQMFVDTAPFRSSRTIRKSCASLPLFAHAHAELVVPLKNLVAPGQRRFGNFADRYAVFPVRRADGDVARVAAQAAGEFRIADRN